MYIYLIVNKLHVNIIALYNAVMNTLLFILMMIIMMINHFLCMRIVFTKYILYIIIILITYM